MRLDKFLVNLKYGSRTEIKSLCKKGLVCVNGLVCKNSDYNLNTQSDVVTINGVEVFYKENITLIMNKPQGYICSHVDEVYPSLLNLLEEKYKRFDFSFAGRLDVDTEGLVILSTDGKLIHEISSPSKNVSKTYYVKTTKELENEKKLEEPLKLLDGQNSEYITSGAKVEKISPTELFLTISEGKFHQVKRMLEAIDNKVAFLKRIRIGNIKLPDDLSVGEYKEIDPNKIFN
jgi:16S rRNA pseudouridine516 synthase